MGLLACGVFKACAWIRTTQKERKQLMAKEHPRCVNCDLKLGQLPSSEGTIYVAWWVKERGPYCTACMDTTEFELRTIFEEASDE